MKKRGVGTACVIYPMDPANKSSSTAAFVKINHDGSATIYNGSTDLGQGSNTVLMQIASETLGISLGKLRFITSDTETTPYDEGTGASRATYIVGNASVRRAWMPESSCLRRRPGSWSFTIPASCVRRTTGSTSRRFPSAG